MYDFNFICRPSKADKNGLSPIELSIIINSQRTYVSLPLKVNADDFRKKMASRRNNEILEYTSNVRTLLNKYCSDMMVKGVAVTAASLKEYFKNGGSVTVYKLSDLIEEFLSLHRKKSEVGLITNKSFRKYELDMSKFIEFMGDVDIATIKPINIEDFRLELSKTYEPTSVSGILGRIKGAFIFAVNNGKIRLNPFNQIVIGKNYKEVEKLDDYDVEKIEAKDFCIERLNKVRDMFLFQIYTGLSYSDMIQIEESDIKFNDGMHYVRKPRQKTGIIFFTVLDDNAMNILKKYDFNMNIMSNQKCNAYLKEIQDICGIKKPLHTHLARHTAATRMLNNGIPLEVVSKVLGHTNTTQTAHYAKLLDKTVLSAFKKIM
jgi:site-specific recombinase XerD